jgi:hypothetical protein
MAQIRSPHPVKLFTGLITSLPLLLPEIEEKLIEIFGSIDFRSEQILFDFTKYYDREMGTPLYRYFFSFTDLIDPAAIAEIKVQTNELEADFARRYLSVQRPVNLDPGYLELSKIVLASTKNYFHRILISGGIYAEITLHFEEGEWRAFPWTFPDYKTERYQSFFYSVRNIYNKQLRTKSR